MAKPKNNSDTKSIKDWFMDKDNKKEILSICDDYGWHPKALTEQQKQAIYNIARGDK